VAYNEGLKHLAVANNEGIVTIREVDWAKVDAGDGSGIAKVKKTLFKKVKKAEWIEAMAYSLDDKHLAVGSHDNMIYLLSTKTYKEDKKCALKGHSSFITAVDFDTKSKYVRSVSGAYELLFHSVADKKHEPSGASKTQESDWCD